MTHTNTDTDTAVATPQAIALLGREIARKAARKAALLLRAPTDIDPTAECVVLFSWDMPSEAINAIADREIDRACLLAVF